MREANGPWAAGLTYAALAGALLVAPLLPFNTVPRGYATPDVLIAVTAAWAVRRPDALPAPLVGVVFLLADFLFGRPPGLRCALALVMTEWLRRRAARLRRGSILSEWAAAGSAIALVGLVDRAVLAVVMTPQAPLGLTLMQLVLTIALYPAIGGVAQLALGLRRPAQGEVDALGHKL